MLIYLLLVSATVALPANSPHGNAIQRATTPMTPLNRAEEVIPKEVLACVNKEEEGDYRWHRETNTCQLLHRRDLVCPKGMWMIPAYVKGDYYGECECITRKSEAFVYHTERDECYALYTQAYCPNATDWLIHINGTEGEKCVVNPCLDRESATVLFNEECVTPGDTHPACPPRSVVGFEDGKLTPSCVKKRNSINSSYHITIPPTATARPAPNCKLGGKGMKNKRCTPTWSDDF